MLSDIFSNKKIIKIYHKEIKQHLTVKSKSCIILIRGGSMSNRTKKHIKRTIQNLMKNNNFQELTISEICATGDFARRTFYNHYKTKEDVVADICSDITRFYLIEEYVNKELWIVQIIEKFFETTKENSEFLDILRRENLFHLFAQEHLFNLEENQSESLTQAIEEVPEIVRPYILSCYTSTALKFYEIWSSRDFRESIEDITNIFMNVVHNQSEYIDYCLMKKEYISTLPENKE